MQKSERKTELIVLLLIIAAICGLLRTAAAAASKFVGKGIGPMAFPQVILIMMLLLSLARLVFTLRYLVQNRSQQDTSPKIDPRVWATYILIIVYAALWNVLGFSISTFVYFIAQAYVIKRDVKPGVTVLIALILAVAMYLFFAELFLVNFPEPILELIIG